MICAFTSTVLTDGLELQYAYQLCGKMMSHTLPPPWMDGWMERGGSKLANIV